MTGPATGTTSSTGLAPNVAAALSYLFGIVALILWLVLMFKAFQGEEWEVPVLGKYARQYSSAASI